MKEQMHEYLSRNLIDNSFEFNWKKKWYDILYYHPLKS
jgi:hypothetical protein